MADRFVIGVAPIDYGPVLLRKPTGFGLTTDTLSSGCRCSRQNANVGPSPWLCPSFPTSCPFRVHLIHAPRPARHYPRFWIWRSSSERQRDFNPPDSCAAQRTLRAPPPPVHGQTPNAPGGRADLQPPQTGFPCCPMFLVDMPSPTTPAKRIEPVVQIVRSVPAFPQSRQGRPSHRVFRGRLGVHACYSLPTCRRPDAALCLPGFDHFVTSMAAGIATRPGRPLPGQDFHLLEQRTFHGTPGPAHRRRLQDRTRCLILACFAS